MLARIWAIAINTFREAVRDRVLHGVIGLATGVLLLTLALAELSLDQQRRVVLDVGLASISLFSVVTAVFLGSSLLYKEIERRTLYVMLPKPIHRHEFLLGKYVGIALTALVFVAIMGAVQLWVTAIQAEASPGLVAGALALAALVLGVAMWRASDRTAVVPAWSLGALALMAGLAGTTDVDVMPVLSSLALVMGEVLLVGAVAMLFSSFSTPFLTGALTVGVWIIGRSADEMESIPPNSVAPEMRAFLESLAWVVPNFDLFVPQPRTLLETSDAGDPATFVAQTLLYALVYSSLLVASACLVFRRRDFL